MKTISRSRHLPFTLAAALAAAVILSSGLLVQAQPNPDRPERPRPPGGELRREPREPQGFQPGGQPGGPGGFRGGQGAPMLEQVLTEDQRESMRQTMQAQREEMRGIQEKMRDARKALMTAAFAENYNEATVNAKALAVAKLEAELTVLRLKAIADVQPALSKEQLEQIINPQPPQGFEPGGDGPRPNRRPNRPAGPGESDDQPLPSKRRPQ